jgi:hypothetical protein
MVRGSDRDHLMAVRIGQMVVVATPVAVGTG